MSILALRDCVDGWTVMTTLLVVLLVAIHPAFDVADHEHCPADVTLTLALPPPAGSSTARGAIVSVQPLG